MAHLQYLGGPLEGCGAQVGNHCSTLYKSFLSPNKIKPYTFTCFEGYSAYLLHPFLLTAILNLTTPGQSIQCIRTRNIVVRTFGMLKSQFRCLDRIGGALLYSPRKAQIVAVCCIFHNVALLHRLGKDATEVEAEDNHEPHVVQQGNTAGIQTRGTWIQSNFL